MDLRRRRRSQSQRLSVLYFFHLVNVWGRGRLRNRGVLLQGSYISANAGAYPGRNRHGADPSRRHTELNSNCRSSSVLLSTAPQGRGYSRHSSIHALLTRRFLPSLRLRGAAAAGFFAAASRTSSSRLNVQRRLVPTSRNFTSYQPFIRST